MIDESMHKQAREILSSELFWPKIREPVPVMNGRQQVLFANVEHVTKEQLEYIAREGSRLSGALLRARRYGLTATLTLNEWLTIIHRYQGRCAYCTQSPYEVLEHVIPISLGGGTTAENCVPACQSCNALKKNTSAYLDDRGNLFIIKNKRAVRDMTRRGGIREGVQIREITERSPQGTLLIQTLTKKKRIPYPPHDSHTGQFVRPVK